MPLLTIRDLVIKINSGVPFEFRVENFWMNEGETVCLFGQSGFGKSTLIDALLGLTRLRPGVVNGVITFYRKELLNITRQNPAQKKYWSWLRKTRKMMKPLLGKPNGISVIFQDPDFSLDPLTKIKNLFKKELSSKNNGDSGLIHEELRSLNFDNPEKVLEKYPYELSPGEQQRIYVMQAVHACPKLLLADEPTASLDSVNQKIILDFLKCRQEKNKFSMLFVTHDRSILGNNSFAPYHAEIVEEKKNIYILKYLRT